MRELALSAVVVKDFFFVRRSNGNKSGNGGHGFPNCFHFGKCSVGAGIGDKSPSQKISPKISPKGVCKKSSKIKDLRKISPISPISPGCRGYFVMRLRIHKETLNFTLLIYIYIRESQIPGIPKGVGILGILGIFS